MKLITYSFFEPKQLPQHRFWDKNKGDHNRYYYNIPVAICLNKKIFPDYTIRFYITENVLNNLLSSVFFVFRDEIELVICDMDYSLTEPSLLRMTPLWEDVDVLAPRDIDSIPTDAEYKYLREFEDSTQCVGTLRTHENHWGGGCCMLAGLSSFKPNKIPIQVKGNSFSEYASRSHRQYGCDQDLMISTFTNPEFTRDNFLDGKSHNQHREQHFPCSKAKMDYKSHPAMEIITRYSLDNWAGEPVDSRRMIPEIVPEKYRKQLHDFWNVF